jgi:hypothetical protein
MDLTYSPKESIDEEALAFEQDSTGPHLIQTNLISKTSIILIELLQYIISDTTRLTQKSQFILLRPFIQHLTHIRTI